MKKQLGIVTAMHCYVWQAAPGSESESGNGIEDEIFSGWAVRAIGEIEWNGWVKIETHYGYEGYVDSRQLCFISGQELAGRQSKERFCRIGIGEADLLSEPRVQGLPLELLVKDALVEVLEWDTGEGFSRIKTAIGQEGYVHTKYLARRMDDDGYLLSTSTEDPERKIYFRERYGKKETEDKVLRASVIKSAKRYLGTQYRWGGKSSQGIDCSGLAFMSYLENGILIHRDAHMLPEYPVQEIGRSRIKPADLLFFPGHVAIYLGDGKYIHSTGYAGNPGVTINSLNPGDPDYREDLDRKMTGCGSVFAE